MPRIGLGKRIGNDTISGSGGVNPLLDDFPGATLAISIRRLSSSFTGPVVKVRGVGNTGGDPTVIDYADFDFVWR